MTVKVDSYRFEILLIKEIPQRLAYRGRAMKAAALCLRELGPRVFKNKLQKNFTYGLNLAFVTPGRIKQLNREFRKKNKITDVLSFSQIEVSPKPWLTEVGDVVICFEVALKNAAQDKITPAEELEKLVIHGVLHLFGFDHERNREEARKMFLLQDKILGRSLGRAPKIKQVDLIPE